MNHNDLPHHPAESQDVGEQNIERLLGLAYLPEQVDGVFVQRLEAHLCEVAQQVTRERTETRPSVRSWRFSWQMGLVAGLAATLFGPIFCLQLIRQDPTAPNTEGPGSDWRVRVEGYPSPIPPPSPDGNSSPVTRPNNAPPAPDWLTAFARFPAPAIKTLAVGEVVETGKGELRLANLPDGSLLYLNRATKLRVESERQVKLTEGEVYLEVTPTTEKHAPFVVQTKDREVTALGTKLGVKAKEDGTGVVVTQGKVKVNGVKELITAGQELVAASDRLTTAPRASHVLDWTRDLMTIAESPLVPQSQFKGGALLARNAQGQETRLSLRKYHIDVHVEDGFARTTIDQTYFNHENQRLEGTFHFPLPADASLSRLAMYVEGNLMEGGMVERDYGRAVYEGIVRKMKDPALLEWVDGTTFKMRVFPLEGRQEKRIVLSYTQKLPTLYGRTSYRFPAGHNLEVVRDWSFHARIKNGDNLEWNSDSHVLNATREKGDLLLDASEKQAKMDRDILLTMSDGRGAITEKSARFSSCEHEGARYLMVRYRPELADAPELKTQNTKLKTSRNWVFLFESSADRDPLLARAQIDVVRTFLTSIEHDDTFALLTAGTRVHAFAPELRPATRENVRAGIEFLERSHLIGNLDLGGALTSAQPFLKANSTLVHVGSGMAAIGETQENLLVQRVPESTRYVGVGVGKRWSRGFMKAAANRTGGYFTQINPDEPIAWRAFDLYATLQTPRLLNIKIIDGTEKAKFLCENEAINQGEELCAIARIGPDDAMPESVVLSGTLDGRPFSKEVAVKNVADKATYLPRTWAKLEIEKLLAEDAVNNKSKIIELSKAMYVMTPYTSLLVLENEKMYADFNVDRGRKDHWAMYPCPQTIPVVREPLTKDETVKLTPVITHTSLKEEEVLKSILVRVSPSDLNDVSASIQALSALNTYTLEPLYLKTTLDLAGKLSSSDPEKMKLLTNLETTHYYKQLDQLELQLKYERGQKTTAQSEVRQRELEKLIKEYESFLTKPQPQVTASVDPKNDPKTVKVLPTQPGPTPTPVTQPAASYSPSLMTSPPVNPITPVFMNPHQTGTTTAGTTASPSMMAGLPFSPPGVTYSPQGFHGGQGNFSGGFNGFGGFQSPFGGQGSFQNGGRGYGLGGQSFGASFGGNGFAGGPYGFPGAGSGTGGSGLHRPSVPGVDPTAGTTTVTPAKMKDLQRIAEAWGSLPERERVLRMQEITRDLPPAYREAVETYFRRLAQSQGTADPNDPNVTRPTTSRPVEPVNPFGTGRSNGLQTSPGYGLRSAVPMLGKVPLGLDFGFPSVKGQSDREEMFSFWLGFFGNSASPREGENRQKGQGNEQGWLYQRPALGNDPHLFYDVVAHAPGMNTQLADILAAIETETSTADVGKIDPKARQLIEKARGTGWQTLETPGPGSFKVTFDGSGRISWERLLPTGLREQVSCDGKTLLHAYPEIGLGARRPMSRFHRAELAELVPWLLPPVEDLADGADVIAVGKQTVVIVPKGADSARGVDGKPRTYVRLHLVFAAGRLAERQLVEMPSSRVLTRETYSAAGVVTLLDATGKETSVRKFKLGTATTPPRLETRELVVLPLPWRTLAQVVASRKLNLDGNNLALNEETALAVLAAAYAEGNSAQALHLISQRYLSRGDHRLGFYVLLGRKVLDVNQQAIPRTVPHQAWLQYLRALQIDTPVPQPAKVDVTSAGFLQRLTAYHELYRLWTTFDAKERPTPHTAALSQRTGEYLRRSKGSLLDWSLLGAIQPHLGSDNTLRKAVVDNYRKLEEVPGLEYASRYETARLFAKAGKHQEASTKFKELYSQTLTECTLPMIDPSFRLAMLGNDPDRKTGSDNDWSEWMLQTATRLIAQNHRLAVLVLMRQCHQLGDTGLALRLLSLALDKIGPSEDRTAITLSAVGYLTETQQYAQAEELLQPLLADPVLTSSASLWRLSAHLAHQRQQPARAFASLERALAIEYAHMTDAVSLESVRQDYGSLLTYYDQLASAMATLQQPPSMDFLARVIRTADRWRSLDPEVSPACQSAAQIFKRIGANDLAWDYLTTPLKPKPGESAVWLNLARTLAGEGHRELADRAYSLAFETESTNAQILYDRGLNLQETGKRAEAVKVFQRVVETNWPTQFQELKLQAQQQLERPTLGK